jgi:peptidoglycan/LPS O-acetylase OafA/YrhL
VAYLGRWSHNWAVSIALSIPLVACVAAFSWHGIEKHVLKLRRYLPAVEDAFVRTVVARFRPQKVISVAGE